MPASAAVILPVIAQMVLTDGVKQACLQRGEQHGHGFTAAAAETVVSWD